jgi:hypothetical protein
VGVQKPGFLRKYWVSARRFGKKPGFFGGVRLYLLREGWGEAFGYKILGWFQKLSPECFSPTGTCDFASFLAMTLKS